MWKQRKMIKNHGGDGGKGEAYGGSFKAMDELVDESVLRGGWANHQVFFKASWRRILKRKLDK